MIITVGGRELMFQKIGLCFEAGTYENVFSDKNNKTVAETLNAKRYKNLKGPIEKKLFSIYS
jgi:hypothetical protein